MNILFIILLIGGQIAGAYYLFTQTSGSDVPPSAKSARTKAILGCCVPLYGIPFAAYFFWKFQSEAGQDKSFRQATAGSPSASAGGNPFGGGSGGAPAKPAVQQGNPFASGEQTTPARPAGGGANPFATADTTPAVQQTGRANPFATGDTSPAAPPTDNPFAATDDAPAPERGDNPFS